VKRTCIKVLPSLLVIHLMRFGFDWESGRSIKYDEQIRVRKLFCMASSLPHCFVELDSGVDSHSSYSFFLLFPTF